MDDLRPTSGHPYNPENVSENETSDLSISRLIAERSVLKCIPDVLHDPIAIDDGSFVSLDDVRYEIRFESPKAGEDMNGLCPTIQCDGRPEYHETTKPNRYRFFWRYQIGECAVRLGIGWNSNGGKIEMDRGFLELNPNKAKERREVALLLRKLQRFARSVDLVRYDIAVDIPVQRESCRMRKDSRGYDYINHGRGITEYLGTREKPARVKLYDKTREAGLEGDWTRLELTCAAEWDSAKIMQGFPDVYAWDGSACDGETRKWVQAFSLLAAEFLDNGGETIEPYLNILGKKSADRVMGFLASPQVRIDQEAIETIRARAHSWFEDHSQ